MRLTDILLPSKIVPLALLAVALGFGVESLRLGLWNYGMPGVGLTPLIACTLLLPVSVYMLLEAPTEAEREARFQAGPLLAGLGFCGYVVALTYLGLILPTLAVLIVWTRFLYRRPWKVTLLAAGGVTLALYVVFIRLLGIPLAVLPA